MVASRERQHKERLTIVPSLKLNVLPVAAVYGGNASGKSNFYYALEFARNLITRSKANEDGSIDVEPFRLDEKYESQPSEFAFEILLGREVYKYAFAVSSKRVCKESLELLKGEKGTVIFSRSVEQDKDKWNLQYFAGLDLPKDETEFVKFKARDTLPNQLFLNAVRGRKLPILEDLADWFKRTLMLIDPTTTSNTMNFSSKGQTIFRGFCTEALNKAQTGIDKVEGEEIAFESVDIPKALKEMFKEMLKDGDTLPFISHDRKRYTFYREKGQLKCLQLFAYHHGADGKQIRFDLSDESEGTQRLIDLLPAFYYLLSPDSSKVVVIDELNRSLHTLLTRNLLEGYLGSRGKESKGQLIFTTHDGLLLDQSLFRRDEFWFIDKDEEGASTLVALSDFKDVRLDKDIRKSYLLGRFGGIPIMRSLRCNISKVAK
jgi:AAA15 family ATPase/GTPase